MSVIRLTFRKEDNIFGLLKDDYANLKGILRKNERMDADERHSAPTKVHNKQSVGHTMQSTTCRTNGFRLAQKANASQACSLEDSRSSFCLP